MASNSDLGIQTNLPRSGLIPILYRIPFGNGHEIVSGYIEKKKVSDGKRFYGHFKCGDCGNRWNSGHSWQGFTQECQRCRLKNWPEKVYHLEQGPEQTVTDNPHMTELCGKCQELGHSCQGEVNHQERNRVLPKSKFDQCFSKQFELGSYGILLEPKFIRDLYDALWDRLTRSEREEFVRALRTALRKWGEKREDSLIRPCQELLQHINPTQTQTQTNRPNPGLTRTFSQPLVNPPTNTDRNPRITTQDSLPTSHFSPSPIMTTRNMPNNQDFVGNEGIGGYIRATSIAVLDRLFGFFRRL